VIIPVTISDTMIARIASIIFDLTANPLNQECLIPYKQFYWRKLNARIDRQNGKCPWHCACTRVGGQHRGVGADLILHPLIHTQLEFNLVQDVEKKKRSQKLREGKMRQLDNRKKAAAISISSATIP
jgi:hypothetical protein